MFRRRPPSAARDADALARAGRHRAAIDLLNEANRAGRDARLEDQLVRLRREGADIEAGATTPPPWPDAVDDLWPGERIPDVPAEALDVDVLRSAIHHHGSLIVRGLARDQHVERLVAAIDAALAAFDASDVAVGRQGRDRPGDGWYRPFRHELISDEDRVRKRSLGSVLAVESPPALFDVIEVMDEIGIRRLLDGYFGEAAQLLARKVTLRLVARDTRGGWHQDGAFMGRGIRSLNVWLALSRCGDVAPGLDIVGRRLDEVVPADEGAYAPWGLTPAAAERVAGDDIVRPTFEPGDALLFDHLCLHRTATSPGMAHDRYAVETWFLAPSTYGAMSAEVEGGYTPRDQVPLLF